MIEKIAITSEPQWLQLRLQDLTASDVGSLYGVGFRSPLKVYAEKMGLTAGMGDNSLLRRGRWFEPAVLKALEEERPNWQIKPAKVYLRDPAVRLGATPDAVAIDPERIGIGVVQCKVVARPIFKSQWLTDPDERRDETAPAEAPWTYELQTLTEMMLAGATWGVIAAVVLDSFTAYLRIFPVQRDPNQETDIYARVSGFWSDIKAGRMPRVDPERDSDTVAAIWPKDDGTTIDLSGDNEIGYYVDALMDLKAEIKVDTDQEKKIKTSLAAKLQGHTYGKLADGRLISLKTIERAGYTVPPSRYRALKIIKGESSSEKTQD